MKSVLSFCLIFFTLTRFAGAHAFAPPSLDTVANSDAVENLNIQIVNTQGGIGNITPASTDYINFVEATVAQRYAIAGVNAHISYNPSSDLLNIPVPTNSPPTGITLNAFHNNSAGTTGGDEQIALQLLRSKYGAYASSSNTIYMVIIPEFANANLRGESYTDAALTPAVLASNPNYVNAIHCCFVAQTCNTPSIMAPPHEIGHQLLNQVPADLVATYPPDRGHYHTQGSPVGLNPPQNLMYGLGTQGLELPTDSKRLWDDPAHTDGVHTYQIDYLRQSPLLY